VIRVEERDKNIEEVPKRATEHSIRS